jgi:hypothetical protein
VKDVVVLTDAWAAGKVAPSAQRQGRNPRCLVEIQPVVGYGLKGRPQCLELYRLLDATVRAELIALGQLARIVRRGQDHNRCRAGARVGPNGTQDFETVQLGKFEVEKDQAGRRRTAANPEGTPPKQEVEGLLPIAGYFNLMALAQLTKRAKGELDLERIVFDQQNVGQRAAGVWGRWAPVDWAVTTRAHLSRG